MYRLKERLIGEGAQPLFTIISTYFHLAIAWTLFNRNKICEPIDANQCYVTLGLLNTQKIISYLHLHGLMRKQKTPKFIKIERFFWNDNKAVLTGQSPGEKWCLLTAQHAIPSVSTCLRQLNKNNLIRRRPMAEFIAAVIIPLFSWIFHRRDEYWRMIQILPFRGRALNVSTNIRPDAGKFLVNLSCDEHWLSSQLTWQ